jgi:hypothetical protein
MPTLILDRIPICITCVDSSFEDIGRPFMVCMEANHFIGDMLMKTKERYSATLRDVDCTDLVVWKLNIPVRLPPKLSNTRSETAASSTTHHDYPTRSNVTINTLLGKNSFLPHFPSRSGTRRCRLPSLLSTGKCTSVSTTSPFLVNPMVFVFSESQV